MNVICTQGIDVFSKPKYNDIFMNNVPMPMHAQMYGWARLITLFNQKYEPDNEISSKNGKLN